MIMRLAALFELLDFIVAKGIKEVQGEAGALAGVVHSCLLSTLLAELPVLLRVFVVEDASVCVHSRVAQKRSVDAIEESFMAYDE